MQIVERGNKLPGQNEAVVAQECFGEHMRRKRIGGIEIQDIGIPCHMLAYSGYHVAVGDKMCVVDCSQSTRIKVAAHLRESLNTPEPIERHQLDGSSLIVSSKVVSCVFRQCTAETMACENYTAHIPVANSALQVLHEPRSFSRPPLRRAQLQVGERIRPGRLRPRKGDNVLSSSGIPRNNRMKSGLGIVVLPYQFMSVRNTVRISSAASLQRGLSGTF